MSLELASLLSFAGASQPGGLSGPGGGLVSLPPIPSLPEVNVNIPKIDVRTAGITRGGGGKSDSLFTATLGGGGTSSQIITGVAVVVLGAFALKMMKLKA